MNCASKGPTFSMVEIVVTHFFFLGCDRDHAYVESKGTDIH